MIDYKYTALSLISLTENQTESIIFAAFPVATYSSFTIAYLVRGLSFARSLALPFIVAGMWNSGVFAVIVHFTLIPLGTTLSIILGLVGSLISAYLSLRHLET